MLSPWRPHSDWRKSPEIIIPDLEISLLTNTSYYFAVYICISTFSHINHLQYIRVWTEYGIYCEYEKQVNIFSVLNPSGHVISIRYRSLSTCK
jgi:hypothetical protein